MMATSVLAPALHTVDPVTATLPGAAASAQKLRDALARAYAGTSIPEGLFDWLTSGHKPGRLCVLFYSGCDGSFLLHSLVDRARHPRVIGAHPAALSYVDSAVSAADLELFNSGVLGQGSPLERWCGALVDRFRDLYTALPGQPDFSAHRVDRALFNELVHGQLLAIKPGNLDWETLLKTLLLAHACARGLPLDCRQTPVYLWHAHTPSQQRRAWIREQFPDSRLLTVVRYPEKSLDILLSRHAFEVVLNPLLTLLRRLFLDWMAVSFTLLDGADDGRERALRVEDLHERPEDALRAWCDWLDIPSVSVSHDHAPTAPVCAQNGTQRPTLSEDAFEPKLLTHYDRLKVRSLLREDYRAWGYATRARLDDSIAELERDLAAHTSPFCIQTLLAQLDRETGLQPSPDGAARRLAEIEHLEHRMRAIRAQRDAGWRPIPLLLPTEETTAP